MEMGLCWLPFVLCNLGEKQKRMGVVYFLVCGVLEENLIEKEVTLKSTCADGTATIMKKKIKKLTAKKIGLVTNLLELSALAGMFKVAKALLPQQQ